MSGEDAGLDVDLSATTTDDGLNDGGLPHGRLLIDFAEAVVRASEDTAPLRQRLVDELGPEATGHAACTIAAFSGLVRVADGTGIPIDDGLASVSADIRHQLALEKLGGAANSDVDHIGAAAFTSVDALFSNDGP